MTGPLTVLGMAALILLPLIGIFGGLEFRAVRRRPPVPLPHAGTHRSTMRIHAGGRYYGTLPRRDAPPLTEQPIITGRQGRPWGTAPLPASTGGRR